MAYLIAAIIVLGHFPFMYYLGKWVVNLVDNTIATDGDRISVYLVGWLIAIGFFICMCVYFAVVDIVAKLL